MLELFSYPFMQYAFLAAFLASVACGVMGSLVVINRLVFLAGGISHTAYGGVGLAFFFGLPVLPVAVGFTLCSSLLLGCVTYKDRAVSDVMIGLLWAAGMAFGIILLNLTEGYNVDLMSYLFGSILTVRPTDIFYMMGLVVVLLAIVVWFYRDLLALSFDAEFARARGVAVTALYFLLLGMVAIAIILTIQVVGLILVIALLTIPPYMAQRRVNNLAAMMVYASLFSFVFCVIGLILSYYANISSGAAIIAVAAVGFAISLAVSRSDVWRR